MGVIFSLWSRTCAAIHTHGTGPPGFTNRGPVCPFILSLEGLRYVGCLVVDYTPTPTPGTGLQF